MKGQLSIPGTNVDLGVAATLHLLPVQRRDGRLPTSHPQTRAAMQPASGAPGTAIEVPAS